MKESRYPWITEAFRIIQHALPCTKEVAIAMIVERFTERAVGVATRRNDGRGRLAAARTAMSHLLQYAVREEDGMLHANSHRKSRGWSVIDTMKRTGGIKESQTGFTCSSCKTYRRMLVTLGWITVIDGHDKEWRWHGPDDATWSEVTRMNSMRKG